MVTVVVSFIYEKKKYSRSVETVDYVKSVSLADSMMFVKDVLVSSGINVKEASNPQPIGFRGNLLVKRPKFFYCTYSLGITETS